jgi:hypothetical protein
MPPPPATKLALGALIVTVPVVAVTVIELLEAKDTVDVMLPLILPLLKLNVPPAATALADAVFLIDNT